jgi:hypothetical protein
MRVSFTPQSCLIIASIMQSLEKSSNSNWTEDYGYFQQNTLHSRMDAKRGVKNSKPSA